MKTGALTIFKVLFCLLSVLILMVGLYSMEHSSVGFFPKMIVHVAIWINLSHAWYLTNRLRL